MNKCKYCEGAIMDDESTCDSNECGEKFKEDDKEEVKLNVILIVISIRVRNVVI